MIMNLSLYKHSAYIDMGEKKTVQVKISQVINKEKTTGSKPIKKKKSKLNICFRHKH